MAYRDEPAASTKNRFTAAMARRVDRELVEVVEGSPDDWEPDAIAAARAEIARRGLAYEERVELAKEVEETSAKARIRLDRGTKIGAFVAGLLGILPLLLGLFFYTRYQRAGYMQKARDLMNAIGAGLLVHFAVIALVAIVR